jgi:peptide/nickel transport system substrate-binding protein
MGKTLEKEADNMRLFYLIVTLILTAVAGGGPLFAQTSPAPSKPTDTAVAAADSANAPDYGDIIIQGSIGDASTLLPGLASDSVSQGIIDLVYNSLVKIDENIEIVGDLAESWDLSDDGLTWTFHLRKDVKWHDGQPFTSRDVLFTYQVMVDPKTPTAYAEQFKQVEKAETPDDYTFIVKYKQAFARALITWGMNILPAHLLEGQDITTTELARKPVGTGPYKFKTWEQGQRIVLEANPDYFEGRPYIQETVTRIIPDSATMFLELQSGGLDMMDLTPTQYTRQTDTPEFTKNFNKYKYLSFGYTYLGFNLLDPKFKDVKVRQAIAYAINKDEIIDGVLLGLGKPANGPYKPGMWAYNELVTPYPYDPEKARQLLAEAGWQPKESSEKSCFFSACSEEKKDNTLYKDGQPFEFTIITNQGNDNRKQTSLILQQRLKDVGIRVKVQTIEWAAFLKEFLDKKKFEAVVMGWTVPIDPDLHNVWHSSMTREGELNFISYGNEEVDRLIDQGRFTFDREARKKAYDRIQEILKEEVPYVFLYYPDALPIVASRIQGIKPAPAGIGYNFIKWYVPKPMQKHQATP